MRQSRLLLINILATASFYIGSFAVLGTSFPTVDWSGQDVLHWFTDNGTRARFYAWMGAFVSLGLTIFAGQVATLLPRPHRYIFLGGVLGVAITAQVQAWFWAGLAFHPEGLDPATIRTLFAIPAYWGPIINSSMVAMALPFAVLGFGTAPVIPSWLKWLSIMFLSEQAIETITVFGSKGFLAPGGAMNVYLGGILGFLWVGGVVRWCMQRLDEISTADTD